MLIGVVLSVFLFERKVISMKKHIYVLLWIVLTIVSSTIPISAVEPDIPSPVGIRPDAPVYALHGSFWVGTMELQLDDEGSLLPLTVWYPSLNEENEPEAVTYFFEPKWTPKPEIATSFVGQALLNADPDMSGAPYPLLVFSPGFGASSAFYAYLCEHLASYGFVVISPDHIEAMYFDGDVFQDFPMATVARPGDVVRTIDYAEKLTETGGLMDGMIDIELVAVAGHSYGGYTALALAGARYDPVGFHQRCEAAQGDPDAFNCDLLIPFEDTMADMAGIDMAKTDLWPSWGDERVDAIIPMAGDAYMFDEKGLAEVTVPVFAMGGTLDTSTPYEWGTYPTYQYVSSEQKSVVTFENAEHGIFTMPCEAAPWMIDIGFHGFCADPVWDKDRIHDLVNHFTTAFLLDVLKGDEEAHTALLPENVAFPGITYETTMK
jgi:predicted dienelactone hydrolase